MEYIINAIKFTLVSVSDDRIPDSTDGMGTLVDDLSFHLFRVGKLSTNFSDG